MMMMHVKGFCKAAITRPNGSIQRIVRSHRGPAPKKYPVLCHGAANPDCVRCRLPHLYSVVVKSDL